MSIILWSGREKENRQGRLALEARIDLHGMNPE